MNLLNRGVLAKPSGRLAIGLALVALAIGVTVWRYGFQLDHPAGELVMDAAAAILWFGGGVVVADATSERRAARFRKITVIQQIGTHDRNAALDALRIAGIEGWHKDGSLVGMNLERATLAEARLNRADLRQANLASADLQKAELREAKLQGAILREANLKGAMLRDAYLKGADLSGANLQGAWLFDADLQGANLSNADLQGAILELATLQGANLSGANMLGVNLYSTEFDTRSTLPDGKAWTVATNMLRFTDPGQTTSRRSAKDKEAEEEGGEEKSS